jgi:hypothetical protein
MRANVVDRAGDASFDYTVEGDAAIARTAHTALVAGDVFRRYAPDFFLALERKARPEWRIITACTTGLTVVGGDRCCRSVFGHDRRYASWSPTASPNVGADTAPCSCADDTPREDAATRCHTKMLNMIRHESGPSSGRKRGRHTHSTRDITGTAVGRDETAIGRMRSVNAAGAAISSKTAGCRRGCRRCV